MNLDRSDVAKIAQLAKLAVDDAELEHYGIDTTGVEPMAHPLHQSQRLRPDLVTEADQRERFQRLAPLSEGGLYLVPRVVE